MSDTEFGCSGSTSCSPSDCASCAGGCGGSDISSHRTITLTMEDDTEVECAILTIFPVDAKEYIALLPLDENGQNTDGEVYRYSFTRTESGDPMLANIEDDDEYYSTIKNMPRIVKPNGFIITDTICENLFQKVGVNKMLTKISDGIFKKSSIWFGIELHGSVI